MEPTRIRVRHSAVVANDDQPDMNRTTPPRRFSSSASRQAIVTTTPTTPNKGMSFPSPIGTPTHHGHGAASPLSMSLVDGLRGGARSTGGAVGGRSSSRRHRSFSERMATRQAVTCVKKRIVFDNASNVSSSSSTLPVPCALPRPPPQCSSGMAGNNMTAAPSTPSSSRRAAATCISAPSTPSSSSGGILHATSSILNTPLSSTRCHGKSRLLGMSVGGASPGGPSSTTKLPSSSSVAKPSPSPATTASDRFIPNRSQLRLDLCRASVQSAEKRRMAAMEKMAEQIRQNGGAENGNPNGGNNGGASGSGTTVSPVRGENLTPLQSEFRRRMRGALLNVPLEDLARRRPQASSSYGATSATNGGSSDNNRSGENDPSLWPRSSSSGRNDLGNLAYAALPEFDDGEEGGADGGATSGGGASGGAGGGASIGLNRMLSFRSSTVLDDSASLSSSMQSAPCDVGSITGGSGAAVSSSVSSQSSVSSFTQRSTPNRVRRTRSAPMAATADPFSHDQLHVLHRTASGSSSGRFLSSSDASLDPMSMADVGLRSVAQKVGRRISPNPTRILDAPELVDDYYLNLISWGKNNVLAVALGQCLYLWDASTGSIKHLLTLDGPEDYVTSVSWANTDGHTHYIAVGTNDSAVQLWDSESGQKVRTLGGHTSRVSSMAWNQNWLTTGGRDSLILQHDVRSPNHIVSTYSGHTQEVCGLRWNDDGTTLASGGNENYLCLWDAAMSQRSSNRSRRNGLQDSSTTVSPRILLTQHQAAVKALAWCPFHRGLLASGGGTADRTIKFWNTNSGAMLNSIDTGSQVCALLWSKYQREICSSHGFSENQLILWRYPTMTKIQEFKGHTARVLHMEQSPDGATVASAAADETLRFWSVFGDTPAQKSKACGGASIGGLSSNFGGRIR